MPMTQPGNCLQSLGFVVLHTPGISRAWSYEFPDGSSLLVTDVGGYDLPEIGGPYSVFWLAGHAGLEESVPLMLRAKDLYRFVLRLQRRFQFQNQRHNSVDSFHE